MIVAFLGYLHLYFCSNSMISILKSSDIREFRLEMAQ